MATNKERDELIKELGKAKNRWRETGEIKASGKESQPLWTLFKVVHEGFKNNRPLEEIAVELIRIAYEYDLRVQLDAEETTKENRQAETEGRKRIGLPKVYY